MGGEQRSRLTVQSGKTLLNGVDARDVAMDIAAIGGNIDLKTIEIGNVGNARLEISGPPVADRRPEVKGAVSTSVTADDPRSLLQLLGLYPKDGVPVLVARRSARPISPSPPT